MNTIIFIALQLSQPRCIKRIETFAKAGYKVKIYGFDSGLYNESLKNVSFPIERLIKRDKTQGKLKKIYSFGQEIHKILNENSTDDVFYLFGYEIASIAWLFGCKNYIYEEADVTASRASNPILRDILLIIDRKIIRKSRLTVFTSKGFSKYLFGDKEPEKIIYQLNKLSNYFDDEKRQKVIPHQLNIDHIMFGFVGLIRYPNTILRFAHVIGDIFPQHEFHFFGDAEKKEYIEEGRYKNVFYHGRFVNPTDLAEIYSKIDINVVCYDTSSGNVRIAEPNKLYESIFFNVPIVVSSGTFLAESVREFESGYDINCSEDVSIVNFINSINEKSIQEIKMRMNKVPTYTLVDDSYHLIQSCKEIVDYDIA